MKTARTTCCVCFLFASISLLPTAPAQAQQESTTSFDGPPKQIDENATPAGVGFNQKGGELSSTALEQAAIGNATVHYHYYGASASETPATVGSTTTLSTPPVPSAPSTTPGYAPSTYVTPITNSMNTSWHLYQGNLGGISPTPTGQALAANSGGNLRGGSTNFYIPSGMSGYRPSIDNVAYGSGAFVGNWDPYANNGTGSIQGFD